MSIKITIRLVIIFRSYISHLCNASKICETYTERMIFEIFKNLHIFFHISVDVNLLLSKNLIRLISENNFIGSLK